MSLAITGTKTALGPNLTASFLGSGGTEPYVYSVVAGGAGGTIDDETGVYTAPAQVSDELSEIYDTIRVTDDEGDTADAQILVGDPLLLFCEILQQELSLANGRVFLWDQKIFQPTDSGLYIAVSVPSCKPFGNTMQKGASGWDTAKQYLNMMATIDLDIISRGPAARTRKEEVLLALNSIYSQSQQEMNSFSIGRLPPGSRFVNLSMLDGAAIPYRFRISINMQYTVSKSKSIPYFDEFSEVEIATDP